MIYKSWNDLTKACNSCTNCALSENRTNVVLGRGNIYAPILFVGEGPGQQEDLTGLPFVGESGKLFDLLLDACRFNNEDYYIANVVKCRPPNNRNPLEEEAAACLPYLRSQFALIRPKIVVCLGNVAMKYLISKDRKITEARGKWERKGDCDFIATYHPAALLRDESKKKSMWEDLLKVKERLNELGK